MSVFLDANVPFYAAGAPHALKAPCIEILRLIPGNPNQFITDAEVLQEILHRYMAIRRWQSGQVMFAEFFELMRDRIAPLLAEDVKTATQLAERWPDLAARGLVHLAVMRRLDVREIVSADRGFDAVSEVERLDPALLPEWRERVVG